MLGSLTEAEDAVQEAWRRRGRTGTDGIGNLGGRLTTVTGRTALVNDSLGLLGVVDGRIRSVMSVTVTGHRITGMYILAGPDRLAHVR